MSKTDNSTEIAKEALSLSVSNYVCRVIYLVRGVGVAALLQPEIYGIWSVLKALQDSTAFSNLGSSFALLREVALNRGKGSSDDDYAIQQTSLNLSLLVTMAIAVLLLALSFTPLMPDIGPILRISLIVMILSAVTYYIPRQLQAQTAFYFQARYLLVYASLNTVFSLVAVYFWGLAEMLCGLMLAHVLAIAYVYKNGHLQFSLFFETSLAKKLIAAGLPVMLGAALFFFLRAVDQFLVYALIGGVAAGYYAISNFVAMTVTQVPVALAATLFPRMMERQSDGASRREIEHLFFEPMKFLCIGTPIILGLTYFAIEPVLKYFLPAYFPALDVIRIALIGIYFQSIWSLSHSLLLTFDKQRQQMWLALLLILFNIVIVAAAIGLGGSVETVTWVASSVSLLSALLILVYIFKLLLRPLNSYLQTLIAIAWPACYGVLACLLIDSQWHFNYSRYPLLIDSIVKTLLFALASLPLLGLLWRGWQQRQQVKTL